MGQSYFIWNGVDCRSMGIRLSGPVPIVRPEERVRHVEIPGRAGDLTLLEGEDIYNSYIQTATIHVKGAQYVRAVYNWLKGAGYVTFSGEPDRRQPARIIGAITLNKVSRNLDTWTGEVQFYCQPLKEKLYPEVVTLTEGGTVRNDGDVDELPWIKVTASASSCTVTIGDRSLTMSDLTSGDVWQIDCENMVACNANWTADWTKWTTGAFPVLEPGNNTVGGSGWSKLEITRRERFL